MALAQAMFEYLLKEEKELDDKSAIFLGPPPMHWTRDAFSKTKELYQLDFYRGTFELKKYTCNSRYRKSIVLARYDSYGHHTNPDGAKFSGPHFHLYREGYADKFALPISELGLSGHEKIEEVCSRFLAYCNFVNVPNIQTSLI